MAINTSIYGSSGQWFDYQTTNFDDESMKFKQAYIGAGGKRLQDGYGYGIALNEPIDKSLSWCGLGNFSTWSKISYYKTSEDMALIAQDNRNATNFSLNATNGTYTGIYVGDVGTYNSSGTMYYGSIQRWSPKAINSYSSYNSNFSANVEPLTQIPLRNCVMVPYFRVAKQINNANNTTGMDIRNVFAWDYYGTTATGNHTTHPYILSITMIPFHLESKNSSIRTSTGTWRAFSILDEISLQKGLPKDFDKPDQEIMDMVYCYNIFTQPSTINGWTIFGHTVNNGPIASVTDGNIIGFTDAPTGFGTSNSNRTNTIRGVVVYNHPNEVFSPAFTIIQSSQGSTKVTTKGCFHYVEYYDNGDDDNIKEWVRKQIACFGLFFTDDKTTAESGEFNDPLMCLGILDDNNVGQGFYSMGEENEDQKQWTWETTNDSDYNPSPTPTPGPAPTEDDRYDWDGTGTSGINAYRHAYCLSQIQVNAVHGYISRFMDLPEYYRIWDTDNPTPSSTGTEADTGIFLKYSSDYNKFVNKLTGMLESTFLNSDPNACIVDLILFPFNISSYTTLGNAEIIKMGNSELKTRTAEENNGIAMSEVTGRTAPSNTIITIDLGTEIITPKYNDFRDYKPYTTCELTIPYHGTVVIDTADFMGATLGVELKVDLSTGLSTAYVTKNGAPRISVPGNIGIHVPLTAFNSGQYFSDISARGAAIANTKIDQVTGMVSGVQKMLSAGQNTVSGIMGAASGDSSNVNPLLALGPMGAPLAAGAVAVQSFAPVAKTSNTLKSLEEQFEHIQVNPTQVTSFSSNLSSVEMKRCRLTYHRCIMNSNYNEANYGKTVGFATNKTGTVGQFTGYSKFSNAIITGTMTEEEKAMILDKLESGVIVNP